MANLQDWIKHDIREEQDALDENQAHADGECSTFRLAAMEEFMVHYTDLGALPLIEAKNNQDDDSDDESGQCARVGPRIEISTQVETSQEQ
jgi:hypothetical protein